MRFTFKKLGLLGAHIARGVAKLAQLTPARLDFVTLLMHGPLCQRDIAARLCVTEPVISRMVRGLMKQGFVMREIPVADRRFRLVSLTPHGREQYLALTGYEANLMAPNARFDAQGFGETEWQRDWQLPLRQLGLGYLARLSADDRDAPQDAQHRPATSHASRARDTSDTSDTSHAGERAAAPRSGSAQQRARVEIPYDGVRMRTRSGVYRDGLAPPYPLATSWPWTVRVLAPPLERGLDHDPLSDEFAAAWLRAHLDPPTRRGPQPPPPPRERPGPKPRSFRPL